MENLDELVLRRPVPVPMTHVDTGFVGEAAMEEYLERRGFKVLRLTNAKYLADILSSAGRISHGPLSGMHPPGFGDDLRDFLGDEMFNKFLDYWSEVVEKYGPGIDSTRRKGSVMPDFLARRGDVFLVVEVKTNKAYLRREQFEALKMSREYGFIPIVYRVHVRMAQRTFTGNAISLERPRLHR